MRLLALLCALLCAACTAPQRAPRTGHTYAVAIVDGDDGTGWQPWQRAALEQALVPLHATGDRWVIALDTASADLVAHSYASAGCSTLHAGAGGYALGTRHMRLDGACFMTVHALQWGLAHEALHWLLWTRAQWVGHVCEHPSDARDCTALVRGESVLAPHVPEYPDPRLTTADLELLRTLAR